NAGNVIRFGTLTIGDGICSNTNGPDPVDIVRYLTGGCIFGGPGGANIVIKSTGWLDLNGFFDDAGPIAMDGGQITTVGGGRQLSLFPPFNTYQSDPTNGSCSFTGNLDIRENTTFGITNPLSINGPITSVTGPVGAFSLTKNGFGTLYFSGSNSYSGLT